MTEHPTLRRSVLYVPGSNERALAKAEGLPTDGVVLDLEDGVAPDMKPEARIRVAEAAGSGRYGRREVVVRVNGADTPWHDHDVRAVASAGPSAVLVPKVDSGPAVRAVNKALEAAGAPDRTAIWVMVETPAAVLHAEEICAASERLTVLVMGTNDLAKELRAEHVPGRQPLLPALGMALLAARATGRSILDTVYLDIGDAEGFEAECRQARQMGFDGKTLIHPGQIERCNQVFAPSADEVDQARRLIVAYEKAEAEGRGVIAVDGRMVEALHVEQARRTVALAAAVAARSA